MKKINVKKVEKLKLEFEDGTFKECQFSALAMYYLDEEYEGFTKIFKQASEKPFLAGAKLLHCGMKALDEKVKIESAKAIIANMNIPDIMELFNFVSETIDTGKETEKKPLAAIPQDHKKKQKRKK